MKPTKPTYKTALGYARVSSAKQIKGASIDTQIDPHPLLETHQLVNQDIG